MTHFAQLESITKLTSESRSFALPQGLLVHLLPTQVFILNWIKRKKELLKHANMQSDNLFANVQMNNKQLQYSKLSKLRYVVYLNKQVKQQYLSPYFGSILLITSLKSENLRIFQIKKICFFFFANSLIKTNFSWCLLSVKN